MATTKASAPERRPKIAFSLDSPLPQTEWPAVDPNDAEDILELLCRLLQPLSEYRALLPPNNGRRRKKRKAAGDDSYRAEEERVASPPPALPPVPDVAGQVTIGLNSTVAHLEGCAALCNPLSAVALRAAEKSNKSGNLKGTEKDATQREAEELKKAEIEEKEQVKALSPLAVVFVCKDDAQSPHLHAHLPVLCYTANPPKPVKLVALPKGADARLSKAVGIQRVGFLGLFEEMRTQALGEMIERVPAVKVPWLEERGVHLPTRIKALETTQPVLKDGKGNKRSNVR